MNIEIAIPTLLETKEERIEFMREFGIEYIVDVCSFDLEDSLCDYFEKPLEELENLYKWLFEIKVDIVSNETDDDNYKRKEVSIVYHLTDFDIFLQKDESFVWNQSYETTYFEVIPVETGKKFKPYKFVKI